LASVVLGVRAEHRITRDGHEDSVAGVDEGGRQNGERRLAADGVEHFCVGVDAADAADVVEEPGGGFLERLAAVIGVTAVGRVLGLLVEFGDDLRKSHFVRLADAHVDDLGAGVGLKHGIFGAFDLFKLVDGRVFSVVDAADSFREQILNVAFGHCLFLKTALGQAGPSRAKLIREQRLCKPA